MDVCVFGKDLAHVLSHPMGTSSMYLLVQVK